jgi:glycerol kinase
MTYILALDQGTTSSRAIVFNAQGKPIASHAQEFKQHFPQPGWVEHDANEIWQSQLTTARMALGLQTDTTGEIAAIGITNQRETTVLWDRSTGEPIYNAIVWQDRRTVPRCQALQRKAAMIQNKTGLVLDAYFSATKLEWLLDNVSGARKRAERGELCFGTIDSWLIYKLTKGRIHVTDVSNASRTMLFNIHTLAWDKELLSLFNIPAAVLPKLVPSSGVIGETDPAIFGCAIPIAGIAGDQQAATFGQNCFAPGMAKNTYGTGCFMLMNTGRSAVASKNKLLTTVGWQAASDMARPAYCLEGSVFMGGATVQWLRDGLQIIQKASDVQALASSVDDTGDCYFVPAFTGLGTPYWDGNARGTLVGMSRGTTRAHIARAALEAICLQSADVFSAMQADSGIALSELRVDGGATANNLLMQMQANILGVTVVRPKVLESTALGAAYLAGLAVGIWSDAQTLSKQWAVDKRFEPQWTQAQRESKLVRWREAVTRSRNWTR